MSISINKAPIIGLIRYSQKVIFGEQLRDAFEPTYFEYRFDIFKNITLKSFQQQTDQNFVLLLLHSKNIPTKYKERFDALEKENSFLYNIFMEDSQESFNETLTNSFDYALFKEDIAITFRIDNDDAVPNDFIERLTKFNNIEFIGHVIDIPSVIIIQRISVDTFMVEDRYYPSNTVGLAYVTSKSNYKTVFEIGDHTLVYQNNPMLILPASESGGLMTINGENAANTIKRINSVILNKSKLDAYLMDKKMNNIDLNCLHIIKSFKYSYKRILHLFTPPIYGVLTRKLKNFL